MVDVNFDVNRLDQSIGLVEASYQSRTGGSEICLIRSAPESLNIFDRESVS